MLVYRVANFYAAVPMRPFRIEFKGPVSPAARGNVKQMIFLNGGNALS